MIKVALAVNEIGIARLAAFLIITAAATVRRWSLGRLRKGLWAADDFRVSAVLRGRRSPCGVPLGPIGRPRVTLRRPWIAEMTTLNFGPPCGSRLERGT